jgi:hypothetical protein
MPEIADSRYIDAGFNYENEAEIWSELLYSGISGITGLFYRLRLKVEKINVLSLYKFNMKCYNFHVNF